MPKRPTSHQNVPAHQVGRLNDFLNGQFPGERLAEESAADFAIRLLCRRPTDCRDCCVDSAALEPYVHRNNPVRAIRFLEDHSNVGVILAAVSEQQFAIRVERHALSLIDVESNEHIVLSPGDWLVLSGDQWTVFEDEEFHRRYRCPW